MAYCGVAENPPQNEFQLPRGIHADLPGISRQIALNSNAAHQRNGHLRVCARKAEANGSGSSSQWSWFPNRRMRRKMASLRSFSGRYSRKARLNTRESGPAALKKAPPLPTGHALLQRPGVTMLRLRPSFRRRINLTVFRVPSVENETEFKRLVILHLKYDELSPSGWSWAPVSVFQNGWQEHHHNISKAQYDAVLPDFKSRRSPASLINLGYSRSPRFMKGPGR